MNLITEGSRKEVEELVRQIMEESSARGIAVGVTDAAGNILYEEYFGFRDAEKGLPVDRDTIFGMASVTKSFTALAIMQMQMDGRLSVYDEVKDYIPEFTGKNSPEPVRIWHLLCHSGGYFPLPRIVVDKTAREMGIEDSLDNELIFRDDFAMEGIKRVAERLDAQTHFTGRPGQRLSYCNDGFGLLSDIIRRHSDCSSFAEYLDKHILKPLGMNRSNIGFLRNSLDENAAVFHGRGLRIEVGDIYSEDIPVLHRRIEPPPPRADPDLAADGHESECSAPAVASGNHDGFPDALARIVHETYGIALPSALNGRDINLALFDYGIDPRR